MKKHTMKGLILLLTGLPLAAYFLTYSSDDNTDNTLASEPVAYSSKVAFLNSPQHLKNNFPFSQAVQVGDLLFLAGQLGLEPESRKLAEGGIQAEAHQAMLNIKNLLEANGYGMNHLVKCTVMLADINEWGAFNEVYVTFFTAPYPARSAFAASGLALNAKVEVECIAAK